MANIFTPSAPFSGPWYIDREDCIGDSLSYINANTNYYANLFNTLSSSSQTIANNVIALSTVPLARLNDGNQSGNAPIYGCRAWVNFDMKRDSSGDSNISNTARFIREAGNVTSVVKTAFNAVRINFTIPMIDANYAVTACCDRDDGPFVKQPPSIQGSTGQTMNAAWVDMNIPNPEISRNVCVMVFR